MSNVFGTYKTCSWNTFHNLESDLNAFGDLKRIRNLIALYVRCIWNVYQKLERIKN